MLARYINKAYGNARGLELTLDRRMHNRWSFSVNYTYAFADGVASSPAFGANPNGLEFLPNQELPLDWDQRHAVAMSLPILSGYIWEAWGYRWVFILAGAIALAGFFVCLRIRVPERSAAPGPAESAGSPAV